MQDEIKMEIMIFGHIDHPGWSAAELQDLNSDFASYGQDRIQVRSVISNSKFEPLRRNWRQMLEEESGSEIQIFTIGV